VKLAPWQQAVADHPARFKIITAGRRSGKTYLSIRQLCWYARIPNRDVFYITSSYRAAKMIVWKLLKNRLDDLRWIKKINESELSITLKNNSTISLKGSENIHALRGIALHYAVIDEAAFCDPDLFPEVIRPALADNQGDAMFISTPAGKSNYFYDLYMAAQETDNWATWQLTTLEAGMVPRGEILAARNDMTDSQFRQEFEASFEDVGSRIAYAFTREQNVQPYDQPLPKELCIGIDFNLNPISASVLARSGETLHVIDEIEIYSSNTDELVQEINNRYPNHKIYAFPDPSGSRSQTSSAGRSDHIILQNAGFAVKAPRKHDPVKDRINALNARFCNAAGAVNLWVDPKCKRTIECLEKHSYKPGTQVPDKDSGYDHLWDALSYCVAYLHPIRRPAPVHRPTSWGTRVTL
jgi:hypothetical protein